MICLANIMILLWINIIILQNLRFTPDNFVSTTENSLFWYLYPDSKIHPLNMLAIYSEIARLLRLYTLLASICGALTFWRIFQFFQFSPRLSAFTEILRVSYKDIFQFLIMFVMLVFSFAVVACVMYGENMREFADLRSSGL